jgi:hypothetical protein
MLTVARTSIFFMLLLFGALLDEASNAVQAQAPGCDALCRQRMYFYPCAGGNCLVFADADCFCCNQAAAGGLCEQKEDATKKPYCNPTGSNVLYTSSSCDTVCTCGKGYVEAKQIPTFNSPGGCTWWTCTVTVNGK